MTLQSLYVGLTGLTAQGHNIDVIGNNIANVNTVGFRASRVSFDDIYYQTLFSGVGATGNIGGVNPQQIGLGTSVGSIDTIFTQGSPQSTGRLLDLAIDGDGFFVLKDGVGQEYLTRAGNFSLDSDGYLVDPGTGYRLIGQTADSNGVLNTTEAPSALQIDFNKKSEAQQTENVRASGNFDASVGDETDVSYAQNSTNLLGLFDEDGTPLGLIDGDVIKFETGYLKLGNPPNSVENPLDLSTIDIGKGDGVLMTVTATTTVKDLQDALNEFFSQAVSDASPGSSSGIDVSFDSEGSFEFSNSGSNALSGVRVGVAAREGDSEPPADTNQLVGNLFVNEGDADFTRTLNVSADSVVSTSQVRQADRNTSIDIYDSEGNSHTITVALAADTEAPAATSDTLIDELQDSEGRFLIPGGIVPPEPEFSDPVNIPSENVAIFTVSQVDNIVATQGVYSFLDGAGNTIGIRLSDGAVSFNGGTFNVPIQPDGTISTEFSNAGIDITGDSFLNIPSSENGGYGGLMGDGGFTETTTLEDIRSSLEERINSSISQVAQNLANINPATSTLDLNGATSLTAPSETPSIKVTLNSDGSFSFSSVNGNLGASASSDATVTSDLVAAAGGEDQMGLVLDLAALTRSVRVSTVDPNNTPADATDDIKDGKVDNDYTDGGGVTGFIQSATTEELFGSDLTKAFQIGNTDFNVLDSTGNPLADPPTGVDDSGVQLVALSSGAYKTSDSLTSERFSGYQAFESETTAFQALFNQKGYGVAANFDGTAGVDRSSGVPVGIVARADDTQPFETNTIHQDGVTRNTVNYEVVVPNDSRTVPSQTTGSLYFNSDGSFSSYGDSTTTPTVTFDPDDSDPQSGGVDPINFKLDLSGITYNYSDHTAKLQSQDGRAVGQLDSVAIAQSGEIIGLFTNGDSQSLGKILLAKVTNEEGLIQNGNTLYSVGDNAGDLIYVEPDLEGGTIESGSLELSNVDLATEFTNLIVAQRAYQGNARVITTADQILQEIVALKR